MSYANNKGADQPVHPRSLISTFVIRCIDSIICILAIQSFKILASFCSWPGWFESYLVKNLRRHIFAWCGSYNNNEFIQRGNMFGKNASLTYRPQLQRHVTDKWTSVNCLEYVQSRWGLRTPSMLSDGHPTILTWKSNMFEGGPHGLARVTCKTSQVLLAGGQVFFSGISRFRST